MNPRSFAVALLVIVAHAQVSPTTGSIRGIVFDPSHAALANANVLVENVEIGIHRATVSDADGSFQFPLLPPGGAYRVIAEAPAFARRTLDPVPVFATQTTVAGIELALSGNHEQVYASSAVQPVVTTSPGLGATLDAHVLTSLPLNTRDPLQLLATRRRRDFRARRFRALCCRLPQHVQQLYVERRGRQ